MSDGFNVETFEIAKNSLKSGSSTSEDYSALEKRIATLENNQASIHNEYNCDFSKEYNIDKIRSTVINNGSGIIPKQYLNYKYIDFSINDEYIDWDKSRNIALYNGDIKLDSSAISYGEFYSNPIKLSEYIGFRLNANIKIPRIETFEDKDTLSTNQLQFFYATDNYGRIWLFKYNAYREETETPVYITIYNKDMSIYKELSVEKENLFGKKEKHTSGFYFTVINRSINVIFTEENLCIISFTEMPGYYNGINPDITTKSKSFSYFRFCISCVDENGTAKVKFKTKEYSCNAYNLYTGNNSAYHFNKCIIDKCDLSIYKGALYFHSPTFYEWYGQIDAASNSNQVYIFTPDTNINDINAEYTAHSVGNEYYKHELNAHIRADAFQFKSKPFAQKNSIFQIFSPHYQMASVLTPDSLFLSEIKMDPSTREIKSEEIYALNGSKSDAKLIYNLGANGIFYKPETNTLYTISDDNGTLYISKSELEKNERVLNLNVGIFNYFSQSISSVPTVNIKNQKTTTIQLSAPTNMGYVASSISYADSITDKLNMMLKIFDDGNKIILLYGKLISNIYSLNYISFDYDLNIITPETIVYSGESTDNNKLTNFDLLILEDKNTILYSVGSKDFYTDEASLSNSIYLSKTKIINSSIRFYYSTDTDLNWKPVELGTDLELSKSANDIRFKAIFESVRYNYDSSPVLSEIYIETWNNENNISRQSEYYSNQIKDIQNEGKAILTADYETNDGTIDWYVSYDGGQTFTPVTLNEEFVYTHVLTPDFRIKAVLSVKDNAKKLPIIRSYKLISNYVVLHSDLEELQINLMKTNFKIDTLAKASRNGMFKMFVDSFSDDKGIDESNSNYFYYQLEGSIGGNYAVTIPQPIEKKSTSLLLTTSEIIDETKENSKVEYFASLDGGVMYKPITPDVKIQLSNTNNTKSEIKIKMVFYNNARVSAIGVAWD